jgi:uncharacterized protein
MKLLVVVLAFALLGWLLFGRSRKRRGRAPDPTARPSPPLEGMVACAHCGVHLPASEALLTHGRSYCSAAHRDAGPSAP